ncbi:amidohydrolase family protein [uncultured Roseivirga sp.]|uniref:amidohydrolase family protein n=1 Tax=uncultured Roseivirga sp. TaxID=543088 RepID=UPI0030DC1ABD
MNRLFIILSIILTSCVNKKNDSSVTQGFLPTLHDNHVHIMSPQLISLWKNMGIKFSKIDYFYSDIDSIITTTKAQSLSLVSMAYVYSSNEFGGNAKNIEEKVRSENNYLAAAKSKYPKTIKAFFGIDPLQKFALTEIKRCHEELKLDGLKLHFNASQVYLTEPEHLKKVKTVFEYASDNQLPILMHFDNSHPKFGKADVKNLADSILYDLKYVNLQIAHLGTSGGFNQKTKEVLETFIELFESNHPISEHKITFDISAVCLDKDAEGIPKLTNSDFDELASYSRKLGFERIVFGTDYPLYQSKEYLNLLAAKLRLTENEIASLLKDQNRYK